jgi:hypothetical protein
MYVQPTQQSWTPIPLVPRSVYPYLYALPNILLPRIIQCVPAKRGQTSIKTTWLHRTRWSRGRVLNFYSGSAGFESQLGHRLLWLRLSWPSLVAPGRCWLVPWQGHGRFLPNPFHFIIICHLTVRCYSVDSECVVRKSTREVCDVTSQNTATVIVTVERASDLTLQNVSLRKRVNMRRFVSFLWIWRIYHLECDAVQSVRS